VSQLDHARSTLLPRRHRYDSNTLESRHYFSSAGNTCSSSSLTVSTTMSDNVFFSSSPPHALEQGQADRGQASITAKATSTRATGARLKLCQAQAVGRFPAESCSLPILSFPLQPLRPHNARAHARAEHIQAVHSGAESNNRFNGLPYHPQRRPVRDLDLRSRALSGLRLF
jgi:hypothetical protein